MRRQDPLAALYPLARAMLMTSPTAQQPRMRAVRKMARYLLASPLHQHTLRHQRGSWRSWPRNIGKEVLNARSAA